MPTLLNIFKKKKKEEEEKPITLETPNLIKAAELPKPKEEPFIRSEVPLKVPAPAEPGKPIETGFWSTSVTTALPEGVKAGWIRTASGWIPTGPTISKTPLGKTEGFINPIYSEILREWQEKQAERIETAIENVTMPLEKPTEEIPFQRGVFREKIPATRKLNIVDRVFGSIIRRNPIIYMTGAPTTKEMMKTEKNVIISEFNEATKRITQIENRVKADPTYDPIQAVFDRDMEINNIFRLYAQIKMLAREDITFYTNLNVYKTQVAIQTYLDNLELANMQFRQSLANPNPQAIIMPTDIILPETETGGII